jgi:hypothetical protein
MNAYLFTSILSITQFRPSTGSLRQTHTLQTWDTCDSLIIIAEKSDKAQELFEEFIHRQPPDENPRQIEVRKIAGAQFVDQLFTEDRSEPLDWRRISEHAMTQMESTAVDSFEQGYWIDVEQAVRPGKLSPNIETLRRDLPEDIGADLNWTADKQFLFVVSVFSPPPTLLEPEFETQAELEDEAAEKSDPGSSGRAAAGSISLRELYNTYPEARDREAAALIKARNSAVAAWIWRRHAASTRLTTNEIRIDPLCDVLGLLETGEI